jgi:hypothetical protein
MRKLTLLAPLLLTACVNDSASYYAAESNDRALIMNAQQEYFWKKEVDLRLIASNLPACQRQLALGKVPVDGLDVALYSDGDDVYTLRSGNQSWQVALRTCEPLAVPQAPEGAPLGAFRLLDDKLVFVQANSTTVAAR